VSQISFPHEGRMKFRMDQTLRFWVGCSYEDQKYENANRTRAEVIAEILREYERCGDAIAIPKR
jgi:hypothetical protein